MNNKYVIQWHITHLCNLRCKHCYQEEYNNHMKKEDFYIILDRLENWLRGKDLVPQINLTGGEPLLHPNFFEFLEEITKRKFRFSILTNGTMIDKGTAKKIKYYNPLFVQISLDGIKETHDNIRGNGNFEKALQGIDNLKSEGVKVLVSFTAQKSNYKDFKELAKICQNHKVDKLWWDRVVTEDENLYLSTEQFKELVKVSNNLIHGFHLFQNYSCVTNQRSLQCIGTKDCGYRCNAGKGLIIILADGSLMPCRRLPFVIGNIKEDELESIIKGSPIMRELSEFYAPKECYGCKELNKCYGGSRCVTYAQTDKLYKKDINCFVR